MVWRKWSTLVIILIANYLVFSALATWVFPVRPPAVSRHTPRPTFTPGAQPLQRVEPLTYDFLTPSPTPTVTGTPPTATPTLTITRTPRFTLTPTGAITVTGTSPTETVTLMVTPTPRGALTPTSTP